MRLELGQLAAAWPLGVSLAAALAAQGVYAGRRRSALNEALHELRRPLQVLALAAPAASPQESVAIQGSVQMAAAALERLEREVNGDSGVMTRAPFAVRPLLDSALGRWQGRVSLAGGSLRQRWRAGEAVVEGDRCELAQALDNLIANAVEHGGPAILVAADVRSGRLRLAVRDSGRRPRPGSRRRAAAGPFAGLSGRRRRGHGLRVVRRIATAHGGEFHFHPSQRGTEAVLELPLASGADG